MEPDESWQVVDRCRSDLADLLEATPEHDLLSPSLCTGWTVRDVGAHLAIAPLMPLGEILLAAVRARGNFNRMIHDTAVRRSMTRSDAQIVTDLRSCVGSRRLAPSTVWRDPLLDLLVHTQDIARPLGLLINMPHDAAVEAAEWSWKRGFPFQPAQRLPGVRLVADDADWQRGEGAEVHGRIADLLLLSTGRRKVLTELAGPGVDHLIKADSV